MTIKCGLCGQGIPASGSVVDSNNSNMIWCKQCDQLRGTCHTCVHTQEACRFGDPSYMPHLPITIRKTFQNGPMIQIADILNPDRIKEICYNCSCCHNNEFCARGKTCGNYKFILEENIDG